MLDGSYGHYDGGHDDDGSFDHKKPVFTTLNYVN